MKIKSFNITLCYFILFHFCLSTFLNAQTLNIPSRPSNALTGSEFVTVITDMELTERENNIYDQIALGNIPDFYRTLCPVSITENIGGTDRTATFYVSADYLAIGSDDNYFLCPMTPVIAQEVVELLDCTMPTRKMVDAIWSAAEVKLAPQTIPPSGDMITVPVFNDHNTMVWEQRQPLLSTNPLGDLVSGDKKDVVIANKIYEYTDYDRVVIYGWHYQSGTPIQPLYAGHVSTYADYSHGIRLVQNSMLLDGTPTTVADVLTDTTLSALLSDESPTVVAQPYYPPHTPPEIMPLVDSFPSSGRQLTSWTDKYTTPTITAFSPTSPGGDGYVLVVKDPSGGMETTRTAYVSDMDYYVQCDIYCDYRPELSSDGYERVGIFLRDNGNGAFEHTVGGGGYCYGLAWDSNNGRLWCFKAVNGTMTDLNPAVVYKASSGWRTMRIEASGNSLKFICDSETVLETTDNAYRYGQCGIGYHEYFTTNSNMLGTYADNFSAGRLGSGETPVNLVQNGSFESGFTSGVGNYWTKWQDAGSNTISYGQASINKHDGSYSQYWARSDTASFKGGVYQKVGVESGEQYQIIAWLKRQSLFADTFLEFGYDLSGGTDGMSGSVVYTDLAGTGNDVWIEYDASVTATGSYITLFSRAGHTVTTGDTISYFYLDEVSLTKQSSPSCIKDIWNFYG